MSANINPQSSIAYGFIRAYALDYGVVDMLMFGQQAVDLSYREAKYKFMAEHRHSGRSEDDLEQEFASRYECYEPTVEGVYEGVHYRSSWLGGALHFFILHSPYIKLNAGRASPCVPNAAILNAEGDVIGYDVPPDWYLKED